MASRFKALILLAVVLMVVALWGIADVVRGASGPEDLIWFGPLFVASLVSAIAMTLHLRWSPGREATSPPGPGAAIRWDWRRIEKGVKALVTLLIVLYATAWAIQTGDLAMPLITGSIVLLVSWIFMLILWRVFRSRLQGQEPPTS
jgi:hypothetical protein